MQRVGEGEGAEGEGQQREKKVTVCHSHREEVNTDRYMVGGRRQEKYSTKMHMQPDAGRRGWWCVGRWGGRHSTEGRQVGTIPYFFNFYHAEQARTVPGGGGLIEMMSLRRTPELTGSQKAIGSKQTSPTVLSLPSPFLSFPSFFSTARPQLLFFFHVGLLFFKHPISSMSQPPNSQNVKSQRK